MKEVALHTVAATLELPDNNNLQKYVEERNFKVYLYDCVTGEFSDPPETPEGWQKIASRKHSYRLHCLYSSFGEPPERSIVEYLKNDPTLIKFSENAERFSPHSHFD